VRDQLVAVARARAILAVGEEQIASDRERTRRHGASERPSTGVCVDTDIPERFAESQL
jgi:hypothetical protein